MAAWQGLSWGLLTLILHRLVTQVHGVGWLCAGSRGGGSTAEVHINQAGSSIMMHMSDLSWPWPCNNDFTTNLLLAQLAPKSSMRTRGSKRHYLNPLHPCVSARAMWANGAGVAFAAPSTV